MIRPRPRALTIPLATEELQPDCTPPAPTLEAPTLFRNLCRKRLADSSDDESSDGSSENPAAVLYWNSTPVCVSTSEPDQLYAPVGNVLRSVKRPRSLDAIVIPEGPARPASLSSLLGNINLANNSKCNNIIQRERPKSHCGTIPILLEHMKRSSSWTEGEHASRPFGRSPLSLRQDGGKRRRSITTLMGGAPLSEFVPDAQRCRQKQATWACQGRPKPVQTTCCAKEAFTDWPPWAGDLPLNRYSPDQAVTLDPGNFVKEAMRAQLRKRLSCDKPTLCEVKLPQQLYVSSGPSSPRDEDYMDAAEMPVEYDELDCTALPTLELIGHNSTYTHGLPYNDCP